MTRVKVCGHTRKADVAASIEAGVDAVGVIADVPVDTPREVDVETARGLLAGVPPFVSGVLVTMPDSPEQALDLVDSVSPDVLQVHAGMDIEAIETLADGLEIPLLVGADASGALPELKQLAEVADALLLDSRGESGAGGTGRTHDWDRARQVTESLSVPVVLAGGLTPENVGAGVRTVEPFAVDVATGVEASDGRKDHTAVERFVAAARNQEAVEA